MSPAPSTSPTRTPTLRRRSLAAVATFAGVGASLAAFALAPTTASTATSGAVISPVAAASKALTSVRTTTRQANAPVRTTTSVTTARSAVRPAARPAAPTLRKAPAALARAPHEMEPAEASCGGLNASIDAFMQHFYAAHLSTSPSQQVADALAIDQYTKTHTVLIANMLKPLVGGSGAAADAFMQHFYAAHLSTSPGQQVADAVALNQYAKTHTVLIANMLKPLLGGDASSC